MTPITFTIPVRTVSEANRASHEHWRVTAKRAKIQRTAGWAFTRGARIQWPSDVRGLTIQLTRIAPRRLDTGNAAVSMKHVQDGLCDALHIDDGDPRIEWRYAQERGGVGEYAVRVKMEVRR